MLASPGRRAALLIGLVAILALPSLPFRELIPTDEPRFALVARQMVEDPAPLVPHLGYDAATRGGEVYSDKPPVFFWLIAVFSKLTGGVDETSARLPSFFAAIAAVLLAWRLGALLLDEATGFAGALILSTANQFFVRAAWCSIDMLLTALTLGAAFCWLAAARAVRPGSRIGLGILGGVLAAAATLSKGPVGLIYPITFLLSDRVSHLWPGHGSRAGAESRARAAPWSAALPAAPATPRAAIAPTLNIWGARAFSVIRSLIARSLSAPVLAAAAAYLLPVGLWILAIFQVGGRVYAYDILFHQNVTRYVAAWNNQAPWYYYIWRLPMGLFPWTLLLPAAGVALRGLPPPIARSARGLAIGTGAILIFFSISTGKRGVYILPVYFAIALLMGLAWLRAEPGARALRAIARAHVIVMIAAGVIAIVAAPILAGRKAPGLEVPAAALAAGFSAVAVVAALLFRKRRMEASLLAYAAGLGILVCAGTLFVVPQTNRKAGVASFGAELAGLVRAGDVLIVDQEGFEQILFYSHLKGSRRDFDFTRVERDSEGRILIGPKARGSRIRKQDRRIASPEAPLEGIASPGAASRESLPIGRAITEPEDQRRTTSFTPDIRLLFIVRAERAERIRTALGPGCRTLLAARIYDKPYLVLASHG